MTTEEFKTQLYASNERAEQALREFQVIIEIEQEKTTADLKNILEN